MGVVIEQAEQLPLIADHSERRLGLVTGEVAMPGRNRDELRCLIQIAQAGIVYPKNQPVNELGSTSPIPFFGIFIARLRTARHNFFQY
jgi:hypothetical protein